METDIWVEKYRPKILKAVILPEKLTNYFENMIISGESRNLLLYSQKSGTGKTTMAKVLAYELGAEPFYVNASNTNIETLKTDISNYARYKSLDNKPKIVILDEADGLSMQFQKALRAFIEENVANCRFILTANTITGIIEPLRKGRTLPISFDMSKIEYREEMQKKILERCKLILENEHVKYDETAVVSVINKYYPEIRMIIGTLQLMFETDGEIIKTDLTNRDTSFITHALKVGKIDEARQFVCSNMLDYNPVMYELYRHYIPDLPEKLRAQAYILVSEYLYRCDLGSSMPESHITALFYSLVNLK